jgi:hypothetical protein
MTAVGGLAPSPLTSNRNRQQLPSHLPHRSDSSVSSSYSERPTSFASPGSTSSRSSPALPPVQGMTLPDRTVEQRNLPPINSYSIGAGAGGESRSSAPISEPRFAGTPPPPRYTAFPYSGDPRVYEGQYPPGPPNMPNGSPGYHLHFDALSEYGDGKQKRRRGNLPKQVTDMLRTWFTEHIAHPYPTEEEKHQLMLLTGLTMSQVSYWEII